MWSLYEMDFDSPGLWATTGCKISSLAHGIILYRRAVREIRALINEPSIDSKKSLKLGLFHIQLHLASTSISLQTFHHSSAGERPKEDETLRKCLLTTDDNVPALLFCMHVCRIIFFSYLSFKKFLKSKNWMAETCQSKGKIYMIFFLFSCLIPPPCLRQTRLYPDLLNADIFFLVLEKKKKKSQREILKYAKQKVFWQVLFPSITGLTSVHLLKDRILEYM